MFGLNLSYERFFKIYSCSISCTIKVSIPYFPKPVCTSITVILFIFEPIKPYSFKNSFNNKWLFYSSNPAKNNPLGLWY